MDGAVTPGPETEKSMAKIKILEQQLQSARISKWLRIGASLILLITLVATIIAILQYERLASCGARSIEVSEKRNSYTADLRELTDRDQENLRQLVEEITQAQSSESVSQSLQRYTTEADAIKKERDEIRHQQDQYQYPSLEDCD